MTLVDLCDLIAFKPFMMWFVKLLSGPRRSRLWTYHTPRSPLSIQMELICSFPNVSSMKVGPYCVPTFTETVGAKSRLETHERNEDDEDESNFDKWKLFVNQNRLKAPKDIGMSSLYPFCDVITNGAVTRNTPVHKISCRYFPLELAYETRQSSWL